MSAQHQSLPLLRKMVGAAATHARLNFCPLVSTEGAEFMKGYEADAILRASATHIGAPEAQSLLRLRQVTALSRRILLFWVLPRTSVRLTPCVSFGKCKN